MDKLRIHGGQALRGSVRISGSKNAALPLLAACCLTDEPVTLENLPRLRDIATMCRLLRDLGARVDTREDNTAEIGWPGLVSTRASYELVRTMRASFLVLGPLVARFGKAEVSLPGGCAIGTRPIDQHLLAIRALGAEVEIEDGYVKARCRSRLQGARIEFATLSVGATQNALMAAALADGTTRIERAAVEPEVSELARMLVRMGSSIDGIGTPSLRVCGRETLTGARFAVMPDRIEAGTYAVAAALTNGRIHLENCDPDTLENPIRKLADAGVACVRHGSTLEVFRSGRDLQPIDIETRPYPGFPTDMQAQFLTMNALARGKSTVKETIFENRFMHVQELVRLGADIALADNRTAVVRGVPRLRGAQVMATDLRASSSLVLAGLVAEGETVVNRIYHIDRGYERIEEKLQLVGADIERVH